MTWRVYDVDSHVFKEKEKNYKKPTTGRPRTSTADPVDDYYGLPSQPLKLKLRARWTIS